MRAMGCTFCNFLPSFLKSILLHYTTTEEQSENQQTDNKKWTFTENLHINNLEHK